MNQAQIQKKIQSKQERMHDRANYLVTNMKVRRSPCAESRNIWMVSSYSTKKKWYVVRWSADLDMFTCACEAFKYSPDNRCMHILRVAIYEETSD